MQTPKNIRLRDESMRITTPQDLERVAGMMALPGEPQCVVPLFSPGWVREITMNSPEWPLHD
jgi:hypothetical protein